MTDIIKLYTADLETGLHVVSLDRPWLETPFRVQGFRLSSAEEIRWLQDHCQYVLVDCAQSEQDASIIRSMALRKTHRSAEQLFSDRSLKNYERATDWDEEYPRAQLAVQTLSDAIGEVFEKLAGGGALDVVRIKRSVESMVDSVIRNPDACIWLAGIRRERRSIYQHALGSSILAVALGRQLGLPKSDLRSLAIGGLLFDIGKLRVDGELLQTDRPLTDEEMQQVRHHVQLGVAVIEDSPMMNQDVIGMLSHHHERYDGSGYPKGLRGDEIPAFARIAAIVDCYDAITSHRNYAGAIAPSTAIKMLWEWRDIEFQGNLVEIFIQAVGTYPAGTLVELSSGEVAVVRTGRLRPRVIVLRDADKRPVAARLIDLATERQTEDGRPLEIVSSLEYGAYDIDLSALEL